MKAAREISTLDCGIQGRHKVTPWPLINDTLSLAHGCLNF